MTHRASAFLWTVLLAFTTVSAFGQGWAVPSKTPETTVSCVGCPNMVDGAKTVGYKLPIGSYTGRFLDSQYTGDWQATFRTGRALNVDVRPALNRIYFRIGSAVFAYKLDTFLKRLEANEPMFPSTQVPTNPPNQRFGALPEQFLKWDEYFYAEYTTGSGWKVNHADGQERLFAFDVDDQGYVYLAYSMFGWGIVKDGLTTSGALMKNQFQRYPGDTDPSSLSIITAKSSTGRYYAAVGIGDRAFASWDVTDRTKPVSLGTKTKSIRWAVKNDASDRVAIVGFDGVVRIFTADGLATGTPIQETTGSVYKGVTTDGTNFYSTVNRDGSGIEIHVFTPSGGTYTETTYSGGTSFSVSNVKFGGDGYLTLTGLDNLAGGWDLRLLKMSNGVPAVVPLVAYGAPDRTYFSSYYARAPQGFVTPQSSYINIVDGTVYKAPDGRTYLIVCAKGLGDVYELRNADAVNVVSDGPGGTQNPHIVIPSTKSFYGDPVKFNATSSNPSLANIAWDFGNPESGLANSATSLAGSVITHQYANLGKTQLGTKTVKASNLSDSNMKGATAVTIEMPVARFGIAGTNGKFLFTQPNASSAAPIVAGDQLNDASDGRIESHYSSWTLDGVLTKLTPSQTMPAGNCGTHSLNFEAYYGPYTGQGATLATNGTSFIVGLDGASNQVNYIVRPFSAAVAPPSSDSSTLTFGTNSRFSSDPASLPGAAALTWKWELLNGSNVVVGLGPSGTGVAIQPYPVVKSSINGTNFRVRLTINSATALPGSCAGMETSEAYSAYLNAPDPRIDGGCAAGGPPCNFTANSIGAADTTGWTYQWSAVDANNSGANVNAQNYTGKTFAPIFTKVGTYTVKVKATNAINFTEVTKSESVTVAGSTCATLTPIAVYLTWVGPSSNCARGIPCSTSEDVAFEAKGYGDYDIKCAPHNFIFDFGDGTILPGSAIATTTHRYLSSGTFTAKVTVNNGAASRIYSDTVTVGAVYQPPPPPPTPQPNACGVMSTSTIYGAYSGAQSGCGNIGNTSPCKTGELVNFTVQTNGYDLNCANHGVIWTIDGLSQAGTPGTSKIFASEGTKAVKLSVTRAGTLFERTFSVNVSGSGTTQPPPTTGCQVIKPNLSLWIEYHNSNNTCGTNGVGPCSVGETVQFSIKDFAPYDMNCAVHTFSYNFGDGSAAVSGKDQTHQFTAPGEFTVKVTANNGSGPIELQQKVKVGNGGPIPGLPDVALDFTAEAVPGIANTYKFIATATPSSVVNKARWEFGDGNSKTVIGTAWSSPVVWQYSDGNDYTVTVRVYDSNNQELKTHTEKLSAAKASSSRRRSVKH